MAEEGGDASSAEGMGDNFDETRDMAEDPLGNEADFEKTLNQQFQDARTEEEFQKAVAALADLKGYQVRSAGSVIAGAERISVAEGEAATNTADKTASDYNTFDPANPSAGGVDPVDDYNNFDKTQERFKQQQQYVDSLKKTCNDLNNRLTDLTGDAKAEIEQLKETVSDLEAKLKRAGKAKADQQAALKALMEGASDAAEKAVEKIDPEKGKASLGEGYKFMMKIIFLVVVLGSVVAILLTLAIEGEKHSGCFMISFGSGSADDPLSGSYHPGVWGMAKGGSTCSGAGCGTGVNGNYIRDTSCGCGTAVHVTGANPDEELKAACVKSSSPGSASDVGVYPFCCECAAANPLCADTFKQKGDVYYQWSQSDPSDILGNAFKGLVDAADAAGDAGGGFFKNFFQHLGFLKYILFAIIGIVVLYLFLVLGRFLMEKMKEHNEEKEGENEAREEGRNREEEREEREEQDRDNDRGSDRRDHDRGSDRRDHDRGSDRRDHDRGSDREYGRNRMRSMRLRVR